MQRDESASLPSTAGPGEGFFPCFAQGFNFPRNFSCGHGEQQLLSELLGITITASHLTPLPIAQAAPWEQAVHRSSQHFSANDFGKVTCPRVLIILPLQQHNQSLLAAISDSNHKAVISA